jgi:hypothetical protein
MRDDDEKGHDVFSPGVSRDQIENAEKMLGSLSMPMYVERRSLADELKPGVLHGLEGTGLRANVKISPEPIENEGRHVVLSREILPKLRAAEISIEHRGRVRVLAGSLEPSRPGRRVDDSLNGDVLKIAFFYPNAR